MSRIFLSFYCFFALYFSPFIVCDYCVNYILKKFRRSDLKELTPNVKVKSAPHDGATAINVAKFVPPGQMILGKRRKREEA
jgi:hypothetical protein